MNLKAKYLILNAVLALCFLLLPSIIIAQCAAGESSAGLESFNDTGNITTVLGGGFFNDGTSDHFQTTDGTDISGNYTGFTGNFFAGEDIDDMGTNPKSFTISYSISGLENLNFTGFFASAELGFDASDFVNLTYSIDGATAVPLISVSGVGTNMGANINDTALTATAQSFSSTITGTGTTLVLTVTASLNSASETIAFDEFQICGSPLACNISSGGETNVICNDNGTSFSNDDFVSLSLNPVVSLPGASAMYSVTVTGGAASSMLPLFGAYSANTDFTFNQGSAGGGDFDITIQDVNEASCDFTFTVTDPGVCSAPTAILPDCPAGCTNIIVQSFEGTAGEWNYAASIDCDAPDDMFTVASSAGNITPVTGSNFFAYEDVESAGCAATKDQTLTFDPIAVPAGVTNIKLCLSQYTDVLGGSEINDGAEFEVSINGIGQGVVNNENCAADNWFQSCVEYQVVAGDMISLVITLGSNGTGEFGGIDDILLCEAPLPIGCVTSGVIFSEIQTDPGSGDATGAEWIELQNITGAAIDISGWYVTNGEFTVRIPDGTSLAAGAFYTIGSDGNNNTNQVNSGSPFNVDLAANGGYNFDLNIDVEGSCIESSTAMYCGSTDEISAFGFIDNNGEEYFIFNPCNLNDPVHAIANGGGEDNIGADDVVTCGDVCSDGVTINLLGLGGSAPAGYYDVEFDLNDNGCTTSYAWNGTEYVLDDTPTPGLANDEIAYTFTLNYMESDGAGGMQAASFSYDIGNLERLSDEETAISAALNTLGGISACEGQNITFAFSHTNNDYQTLAPNEIVQQGGSIGNIPTGWGSGVIFTGDATPTAISDATGTGGGTYTAMALPAGSYSMDVRIREIGYASGSINLTANDCQGYNDAPQDAAMSLDCIIDFQIPITVASCDAVVACPNITAVLSGDNSICNSGSADLLVTITGGTGDYLVTLSDGTTQTMSGTGTISVSPTEMMTYSINSVTDINACPATVSGSATIIFNNTDCGTFPWNGNN